jgi:hypothetical protein
MEPLMNQIAGTVPDRRGYEQVKRSIDSLQRLYTIVVGLAVTEALRKFLTIAPPEPWWAYWRALTILLITIVPFYHGANGHLDQTYLYGFDGRRREKRYALLIDFFVLFVEGVLFFVLALSLNDFDRFVRLFQAILLADVLWASFVYISGDSAKKDAAHASRWGLLNLGTLIAIGFVHDSTWFADSTKANYVFGCAVLRFALDYYINWDFYIARYPMPASADNA